MDLCRRAALDAIRLQQSHNESFGNHPVAKLQCAGVEMSDEKENQQAPQGSAPPTGFGSSSDEDAEYDLHLCLVPYIDLELDFDH